MNKNFKIEADSRVKDDLLTEMTFLETKQKGLSVKLLADYKKALIRLQNNPFYQVRYNNIRCLQLSTFKYMLHFTINEGTATVFVHALISPHKDPTKNWL